MTFMPAPGSFTGEDTIEISSHGAPIVVRRIVDLTLSFGARLAEPGEFSLRALANGKLDLSQAEAIRDLINARTDVAARQAVRQLRGELSSTLLPLKNKLVAAIVRLESAVEFVEDDLPSLQRNELRGDLEETVLELQKLAATFQAGHWLRDGLRVIIAGRPNVGKSSLFNGLLRRERAIVTGIPGTTRDTLSETVTIRGIPVSITDTAGVRADPDEIERMGIDRTHQAIADAEVVLFVIDGTEELTKDDLLLFSRIRDARHLLVVNKRDLPGFKLRDEYAELGSMKGIAISALHGNGLDDLNRAITDELGVSNFDTPGLLVTDARHYDLLSRTCAEIEAAIKLLENEAGEELILVGLHNALTLLGAITGETTTNDILSEIFATFCIGK
jgi:tRNA modification GTPase